MTVDYRLGAGVAIITLDFPDNRNALTPELLDGLARALDRAHADDHVRVVVLTNTGTVFSAGADLKGGAHPSVAKFDLPAILTRIADCRKPVIARIAGHCLGGGVGLAAGCDLAVAADDVRFGFTEVRVGVAPAVISVVCLPKLRRADAMELFLTGERIPASRAVDIGLINRAVPRPSLDANVAALAADVMAGGPNALAAAKQLVRQVPGMAGDEAFRHTAALSAQLFGSEEAAEGMAAFSQKRRPSWAPAKDPGAPRFT